MTISVLQEGQNSGGSSSVSSISVTLIGVTSGSFIHVICANGFNFQTITFSDSNSDTPHVLGSALDAGNAENTAHAWFGPVAAGSITFTCSWATAAGFNGIWAREIGACSGVQASSNITAAATTIAATVSAQPALWSGLGANYSTGVAPTAVTGTQDIQGWGFGGSNLATTSHQRVTATGSVSATFATSTTTAIAIFTEAAGGGGTANLTAQTATFTEGTLGVSVSKAITGQTATFAQGSLSSAISQGLSGQSATFAEGVLTPAVAYAATAQTATFAEGTLTPGTGGDITKALSGQTATFAQGAISPAIANALSGQTITSSEGVPSAAISDGLTAQTATFAEGSLIATWSGSAALLGQTAAFAQGAMAPTVALAVNGQSATFTEGSLGVSVSALLGSQTGTFTEGTLTPQTSGDVTIALTGLTATFRLGQMLPSGGDQTNADTHDGGRKKRRYDDSAQTQVIRESALRPKKLSAKSVQAPAPKPVQPVVMTDAPEDEESLLALVELQDDEIFKQIELATHLLRTLH